MLAAIFNWFGASMEISNLCCALICENILFGTYQSLWICVDFFYYIAMPPRKHISGYEKWKKKKSDKKVEKFIKSQLGALARFLDSKKQI